MNWKLPAAILLLAIGGGAVAYAVMGGLGGSGSSGSATYLTSVAATADVTQASVASGNVAAAGTYALSFGNAAALSSGSSSTTAASTGSGTGSSGGLSWPVLTVAVKLGDSVKAGDVLATADPTDAELQLRIARANLDAANARLAANRSGLTGVNRTAAADQLHQAQLQLSQARDSYTSTKSQNALAVSQAKAAVSKAQSQLAADQAGGASAQTIDADRAAVSQAKDNLASTQSRVTASNASAYHQVQSATLGLTAAQHGYATKVAPADAATIAAAEGAVGSADASLRSAQSAVDHASITAPVDGRVVAVNVLAGSLAPSGTAISVQSSTMEVTAAFAETDIPTLKVGQAATVAIGAIGASATGTVAAINPVASSSGGSSVVTYAVTVTIDPGTDGILAGMSAKVSVVTAQASGVLAVPSVALVGSAGSYRVRVLGSDGVPQARDVTVGLVTSSLAEIQSGLTAGERVVTGTTAARQGTSTSGGGLPGLGGGFNRGGGGGNGGGTSGTQP